MRGKAVELDGVVMRYGGFVAVERTDLGIAPGEFFSILGPSGCGKTTILRMVSGFAQPSQGRILIGGEDMAGKGPNRRPTALIFQNLALFPLMRVWENVAFGLEARGVDRATRRARAEELLALVGLTGQEGKRPAELSGGQRQRVAVARALAVEPAVLLLDEPLSALDLKLRQHMRAELKAIQRRTGVTFVFITHDQGEALAMSDRVAVMRRGRILQVDTPDRIYDAPATPFVATFVGESNVFTGRVVEVQDGEAVLDSGGHRLRGSNPHGLEVGSEAMLFVRPERMRLANGTALDNRLSARLQRRDLEGPFVNLVLDAGGQKLALHLTNDGLAGTSEDLDQEVGFMARDARLLAPGELAT